MKRDFRAGAAAAAIALLGGCAHGPSAVLGRPESVVVIADWNDLDAAVEAAVSKVEMSVLEGSSPSPGERVYDLTTITDEPARLVVTRRLAEEPQGAAPEPLELSASVGRFGDAKRERALLEAVGRRLGDLAGVDYAPIR